MASSSTSVDFYCARARLVIQVDGPIQEVGKAEDAQRQRHLESLNFRVLRFTNEDVLRNLDAVVKRIEAALTSPLPPLHNVERGNEVFEGWSWRQGLYA